MFTLAFEEGDGQLGQFFVGRKAPVCLRSLASARRPRERSISSASRWWTLTGGRQVVGDAIGAFALRWLLTFTVCRRGLRLWSKTLSAKTLVADDQNR